MVVVSRSSMHQGGTAVAVGRGEERGEAALRWKRGKNREHEHKGVTGSSPALTVWKGEAEAVWRRGPWAPRGGREGMSSGER